MAAEAAAGGGGAPAGIECFERLERPQLSLRSRKAPGRRRFFEYGAGGSSLRLFCVMSHYVFYQTVRIKAMRKRGILRIKVCEESSSNDIFGIYDSMVDSMMGAGSAGDMADIYNSMVGSMTGSMQSGSDAYYPVGSDEYTLQAINAVLSDSGLSSSVLGTSSEYSAYPITAEYCALKTEYNDIAGFFAESNQQSEKMSLSSFYIFGAIVIFACSSTALGIFFVAKRREIVAFAAQGAIPVVQEGMEVMTPSIIKMKEEFARSKARMAQENAPYYAEAAGQFVKEVSKGYKDGMGGFDPRSKS